MLEVVFSDSAKGAMKMAKNYNENNLIGGAIAFIGQKPLISKLEKRYKGKSLGGSSQEVVSIGFSLDIGDISGEVDSSKRQEVFHTLWGSGDDVDEQKTEQFFRMQRDDLGRLLSAATKGTPIRVWKSHAPFSACAFAFVCDVLKNIECKISVVSLPEYVITADNTVVPYSAWSEIFPGQLYDFLSYEQQLSTPEKLMQGKLWRGLKAENSPLRAVVNGSLMSVPENFYDHLILKNFPDSEIVMATLIGKILSRYQIGVGDGWYALRIKKMIEEHQVNVVADSDPSHPYGEIIKKATI